MCLISLLYCLSPKNQCWIFKAALCSANMLGRYFLNLICWARICWFSSSPVMLRLNQRRTVLLINGLVGATIFVTCCGLAWDKLFCLWTIGADVFLSICFWCVDFCNTIFCCTIFWMFYFISSAILEGATFYLGFGGTTNLSTWLDFDNSMSYALAGSLTC